MRRRSVARADGVNDLQVSSDHSEIVDELSDDPHEITGLLVVHEKSACHMIEGECMMTVPTPPRRKHWRRTWLYAHLPACLPASNSALCSVYALPAGLLVCLLQGALPAHTHTHRAHIIFIRT